MADDTKATMSVQGISQPRRYFRVQIRAWIGSDPSRMALTEIAEEIERGTAFLTAIEVLKVADDVNAIDDPEVRKSFENMLAVERILQNVSDLPKALRERLSAALAVEKPAGEVKDSRSGLAA